MTLSDLIESVNIVDYISQFVELEQKGEEWWGLSCFHEEKTPSFSVRENPPVFFDYSSGIGGNVYTFVRYYNQCGPSQAIEILKKYANCTDDVSVPHNKLSATTICRKYRPQAKSIKQGKGVVLPENQMERYECRTEKLQVWMDEGISMNALEKFQVRYDPFSDRLVYPIRNFSGQIVNVGGRTLDPDWKEKKLRKYTYFYEWGIMDVLYGIYDNLEDIRRKREVIIFEGCKSVLLAYTWGIRNCAAALTSHLNPRQMKILAKLGCRVVFAFDKEIRPREDHNIQILKNYVNVEYLWDKDDLLDDKDAPVDKGPEVFKKLYEGRLSYR